MIATPQLTEPPAPDLIGRPERNGGGDRGRQSALALHCMPLDARPLHDPPRRLTKISKKKKTQFPVSSHVSSEVDVPRPAAGAAICRNGFICRLCPFSICSLFFPFRQQRKIRTSFKFALLQSLPLLVVSYHANHFPRFNKCVSIQSVLPFRLPAAV